MAYLHAACFSPVLPTLVKAINSGNFSSWTGLTDDLVTNNIPTYQATVKVHLQQQRKNLRSTKNQPPTLISPDPLPNNKPTPEQLNTPDREFHTNFVYE